MTLLGIALAIWGTVCLVVAVIWVFIWPSSKSVAPSRLPYSILNWGHALV